MGKKHELRWSTVGPQIVGRVLIAQTIFGPAYEDVYAYVRRADCKCGNWSHIYWHSADAPPSYDKHVAHPRDERYWCNA